MENKNERLDQVSWCLGTVLEKFDRIRDKIESDWDRSSAKISAYDRNSDLSETLAKLSVMNELQGNMFVLLLNCTREENGEFIVTVDEVEKTLENLNFVLQEMDMFGEKEDV